MMICKYIEIGRCKWNDDQVQLINPERLLKETYSQ